MAVDLIKKFAVRRKAGVDSFAPPVVHNIFSGMLHQLYGHGFLPVNLCREKGFLIGGIVINSVTIGNQRRTLLSGKKTIIVRIAMQRADFSLMKPALEYDLAERQGFEPWNQVSPITRLAGERLQPTRPSLRILNK